MDSTNIPPAPRSCDTFVALPPATRDGGVVFGKNSDRPSGEVQEVVYIPGQSYPAGSKLECTYISIDQVESTHSVILSKPAWMWGAEMGANSEGVCIGNEAVFTVLQSKDDLIERLLGMDMVRLGLERANTARKAVDVITQLLSTYGQGGPCGEMQNWSYHNSFLIADRTEAWILETAGTHWAAEQITNGVRNISNCLTIGTKIDLMSPGIKEFAKEKGLWTGDTDFNFALVFARCGPDGRYDDGRELMEAKSGSIDETAMFSILRDEDSGICMTGGFVSIGSQVSVLAPSTDDKSPSIHWFTGTPNPKHSVYKPFIFCKSVNFPQYTVSPVFGEDDPVKTKPRFSKHVDRKHLLYELHQKTMSGLSTDKERGRKLLSTLYDLEVQCVVGMKAYVCRCQSGSAEPGEVADLFLDCVDSEMKFYS